MFTLMKTLRGIKMYVYNPLTLRLVFFSYHLPRWHSEISHKLYENFIHPACKFHVISDAKKKITPKNKTDKGFQLLCLKNEEGCYSLFSGRQQSIHLSNTVNVILFVQVLNTKHKLTVNISTWDPLSLYPSLLL